MADKKTYAQTLVGGAGAYERMQANPAVEVIPVVPGASLQGTVPVPQSIPPVVDDDSTRASTIPAPPDTVPPVIVPMAVPPSVYKRWRESFTVVRARLSSIVQGPDDTDRVVEQAILIAEPELSRPMLWRRRFAMDRLRRGLVWALLHAFRKFSTPR